MCNLNNHLYQINIYRGEDKPQQSAQMHRKDKKKLVVQDLNVLHELLQLRHNARSVGLRIQTEASFYHHGNTLDKQCLN